MTCVVTLSILAGLPIAWAGQHCGQPLQIRQFSYDDGDVFHEKNLRNRDQCFNLCWTTNPCVAVNFNCKTRKCSLLAKKAPRRTDLNLDFNVVYGEVSMPMCKKFSNPCDKRPCRIHATCASPSSTRYYCMRAKRPRIECTKPSSLPNADVRIDKKSRRTVAIYTCKEGYKFVGSVNTRTCTKSHGGRKWKRGKWTNLKGTCRKTKCSEPENMADADMDIGSTDVGSSRTYTCRHDNKKKCTITCQKNETWSQLKLVCPADCGQPPNISGSDVSPGGSVEGSKRSYTCHTGRTAIGEPDIRCLSNASWTNTDFQCRVDCGDAPNVANASHTVSTPSMVVFKCHEDFTGQGNNFSTCLDDGTWSEVNFECVLVDCGTPPKMANVRVTTTGTAVRSKAMYECEAGYEETGEDTITCQPNGTWLDSSFNCSRVKCSKTPSIANLVKLKGMYYYEDEVELSCINNTFPVGRNKAVCQANGKWKIDSFSCRDKEARILVAVKESRQFHTIEVHSGKSETLNFTGRDSIQDVDYCPRTNNLYWVEPDVIWVASLDEMTPHEIVRRNGTGGFVRVDGEAKLLFFAVRGQNTSLMKLNLDSNSDTLLHKVDTPLALEIDTRDKLVYWAEWVTQKRVMKTDYNGKNMGSVVELGQCDLGPWAVHIDENKRLYWSVNDEIHYRDSNEDNNGTLLHNFKSICDGIRTFRDQTFVSCTNDSTVRVHSNGTEQEALNLHVPISGEKFITVIP